LATVTTMNPKCDAAHWCTALATPNTTHCRLHVKYPLLHSFEAQATWLTRIRRTMKASAKAIERQAKSDAKLAERRGE
jgi:transposase